MFVDLWNVIHQPAGFVMATGTVAAHAAAVHIFVTACTVQRGLIEHQRLVALYAADVFVCAGQLELCRVMVEWEGIHEGPPVAGHMAGFTVRGAIVPMGGVFLSVKPHAAQEADYKE